MSFNAPLTSDNYESLRGTDSISATHRAKLSISLCPNNNVYTARVNQVTFNTSFAQVSYDGGSGTLADVRPGMTVLVSHTNDRKAAFFIGRVRKTPTLSILYINETSAPITNDDYIFVLDDFRIWDKLARDVSGILKPDYEVSFRQLLPIISNLDSAYAVYDSSGAHEFDFAPGVDPATDGATITDYLWEVGDGTITVGSDTDKDVTVEFPAGFRWVHFTTEDNAGRASVFHFPVWVHDSTFPPTLLEHGDLSVEASVDDGFAGSVTAFAEIESILDNTLLVAWLDGEKYNDTARTILSGIALIGRIRTESSDTSYDEETGQIDASTRFDIESPLQQLGRLELSAIQIDDHASPTKFNQIKTMTLWREIALIVSEYSTFSSLHALTFSDMTNNFREKGIVTNQGSLLSGINALANGISAKLQMSSSGRAEIARDGNLLPSADRDSLVTVADWGTRDLLSFGISHNHVFPVGRLDSSGGSYNSTSKKITVAQAIAPGKSPASGDGSSTLHNQILTVNQPLVQAEAELCIRAGHKFAYDQGADELTVSQPDGYWWLTPSVDQWYTFTLDGSETAKEIVLDNTTRWILQSVSVVFEIEIGTHTVNAVYRRESSGSPAQAIRYPATGGISFELPKFPPLPTFPALPTPPDFFLPEIPTDALTPPALTGAIGALRRDGNVLVGWTTRGVWVCQDFIIGLTPTWIEVTPPIDESASIVQCYFTSANPPGLMVSVTGSERIEFDLTDYPINSGYWDVLPFSADSVVTQLADEFTINSNAPPGVNPGCRLTLNIPDVSSYHVTRLDFELNATPVGNLTLVVGAMCTTPDCSASDDIYNATTNPPTSFASGAVDKEGVVFAFGVGISGNFPVTTTLSDIVLEGYYTQSSVFYASNVFDTAVEWSQGERIEAESISGMRLGSTPAKVFVWDADAPEVYYSANHGSTFGDALTTDTPPVTPGGFDAQKLGSVSLAGVSGKVMRATTAGGAYADYGDPLPAGARPTAIFIPRYKFSGLSNGSGVSAVDYLLGSLPFASSEALWKVTDSGVTFTAITPNDGSNDGHAVGPNCIHIPWHSSAYQDILALFKFGSDVKLARSVNGGSTFAFSDALNGEAAYVTTRRSDMGRKQVFIANGPNVAYCANYRASPMVLVDRIGPVEADLVGVEVWW